MHAHRGGCRHLLLSGPAARVGSFTPVALLAPIADSATGPREGVDLAVGPSTGCERGDLTAGTWFRLRVCGSGGGTLGEARSVDGTLGVAGSVGWDTYGVRGDDGLNGGNS